MYIYTIKQRNEIPGLRKDQNKSIIPTTYKTSFKANILLEKDWKYICFKKKYNLVYNFEKGIAAFLAMLEIRQIAQPKNFIPQM